MCRAWSVTYRCAAGCGTVVEGKHGLVSCGKSCPVPEFIPAAHIDKPHEKKYCATCGAKAMGRPPRPSAAAPCAPAACVRWVPVQPPPAPSPASSAPPASGGWIPMRPPNPTPVPASSAPTAPPWWVPVQPSPTQSTASTQATVMMAAPPPPTQPPGPSTGFKEGQKAPPAGNYFGLPGTVPGIGAGHWLWKLP